MYFDSWNPYPFLYLKREKGTPYRPSLHVEVMIAIIRSTRTPRRKIRPATKAIGNTLYIILN